MNIFRVQNKDGRGPWKPGFSHIWIEDRKDHDNLHPWIEEFHGLDLTVSGHLGCGCKTIKQLRRWFTKREYKKLVSLGYKAVCVVADEILAESNIQCVFKSDRPLKDTATGIKLY
jgi:hypothetical protein